MVLKSANKYNYKRVRIIIIIRVKRHILKVRKGYTHKSCQVSILNLVKKI